MNEEELRELDVQVHRALWPNDRILKGEIYFREADGDKSCRSGFVPHYSTDIGAWDAVCALHPEWRWLQSEVTGDGYVAVVTRLQDHARADESQFFVDNSEYPTSGLDRLARGRARCVIAWAAGRGEG